MRNLLVSLILFPLLTVAATPRVSYSTYLGGTGADGVNAVAIDALGNYYVVSSTQSPNFPQLPANQNFPGDSDVVVSKFSAANVLVYSTVLGGSGADSCGAIAADTDGSAFVACTAISASFPRPGGGFGSNIPGSGVLKLDASGALAAVAVANVLVPTASIFALTVDANHTVWVTGSSTTQTGDTDILVGRLDSTLRNQMSFLPIASPSSEIGTRIVVDGSGNIYIFGNGGSPAFPTGSGRAFPSAGLFVVKVEPVALRVLYATFLSGGVGGSGLILQGSDVWACANSNGSNFIPTADAVQSTYGGGFNDTILVRLNASDGQIRYATYFGGNGGEFCNSLNSDPYGNLILAGNTTSTDLKTTADALRSSIPSASSSVFLTQLDAGGRLLFSTYLGGTTDLSFGLSAVVDKLGNPIVVGITAATDFPTTADALQRTKGGANDGYVVRVELVASADPSLERVAIQNAASFAGGAVAPGEIITIYPKNVGPATLVTAALTADRRIATLIGATRVLFDDIASPMVYTVNGQVSLVVPYEVQGKTFTRIVVEYNGVKSRPFAVPVTTAAPGIFTASGGVGQAAASNENGSFNNTTNPATRGSILVFFLTGEGQTTPAGVNGRLNEFARLEDYPAPLLKPVVTIGGQTAEVLFGAGAPNFLAGLMQFNVRVPQNISTGSAVPLTVSIGTIAGPAGVTVAIR